ncbi:MAG: intracellular sulfur oxidation DsrE/DsrF family protein [Roseivirga sp.]|jgi:intracellular sulfur oxidation DsrE/DsrF family protein
MQILKRLSFSFLFLILANTAFSQAFINPIIKGYGGIIDAPHALEKPDPTMEYKVVIDIATGDSDPEAVMYSLQNVARLLNLHAMGGMPANKMNVVLAIHGGAIWSTLDNETYKAKYGVDNPHLPLFKELENAGVRLFACSQSLMGREIDHAKLASEVKVATSMLSVMTTYQLKGYAALKF